MRTTIPLILTFIVGVFMVGEFFIPHWRYRMYTSWALEWGLLLAAGAYLLGLVNLVQVNLPKVLNREADWGYKAVMLLSLVATMVVGFWGGEQRLDDGAAERVAQEVAALDLEVGEDGDDIVAEEVERVGRGGGPRGPTASEVERQDAPCRREAFDDARPRAARPP